MSAARNGRRPDPGPRLKTRADGYRPSRPLADQAFDAGSVLILEVDPDLAQDLSPADRAAATRLLRARVIEVTSRRWEPRPAGDPARTFGLLVLDGLLGRRVQVGPGVSTELLSSGDILRPWGEPTADDTVKPELSWRVFRPARLAVLDARITAIIGRRPELVVAFSRRLLRRVRSATYLAAIGHLNRVEERLLLTLWHLASNWGRVTPQGVVVPHRLTHSVLGEIIGAQRPSVTSAVGLLQCRGELIRRGDGCYVLTGSPEDLTFIHRRSRSLGRT